MMTPKSNLIKVKEVCSVCTKYILIGHSACVCEHCDIIFHTKCAKKAKFKLFRNKQYCLSCITTNDIIRYNPQNTSKASRSFRKLWKIVRVIAKVSLMN